MTNTYTNKKKRRYYYYKCVKVMKEGNKVCSTKEVNAERLEKFLIENLSRIAEDKQYIENLAFRITHETPGRSRLELTEVSSKNLVTRVSQVLINFKNKVEKSTQVEKCLLFQRTISRINFSKSSLEVMVSLVDTTSPLSESQNNLMAGKMAARIRRSALNPDAPACTPGSKKILVPRGRIELPTPAFSGQRSTTELPRHGRSGGTNSQSVAIHPAFINDFFGMGTPLGFLYNV